MRSRLGKADPGNYSKPQTLEREPSTVHVSYSRRSVTSTMLRYSAMLVLGWSTGSQVGLPMIGFRLPVPVPVVPVRLVALAILARLVIDFRLHL